MKLLKKPSASIWDEETFVITSNRGIIRNIFKPIRNT